MKISYQVKISFVIIGFLLLLSTIDGRAVSNEKIEWKLNYAEALRKNGLFKEALAQLVAASLSEENKSHWEELQYQMGLIHIDPENPHRNYRLALQRFEEIISSGKNEKIIPLALFYAAITYEKMDDPVNAEHSFQQLINNYPQHSWTDDALFWLGMLYFRQLKYNECLQTTNRLLKFYPKSVDNVFGKRGQLLDETLLLQARAYRSLGQSSKARTCLERIKKTFSYTPYLTMIQFMIGEIYQELDKDPVKAKEAYAEVLKLPAGNRWRRAVKFRIKQCE